MWDRFPAVYASVGSLREPNEPQEDRLPSKESTCLRWHAVVPILIDSETGGEDERERIFLCAVSKVSIYC